MVHQHYCTTHVVTVLLQYTTPQCQCTNSGIFQTHALDHICHCKTCALLSASLYPGVVAYRGGGVKQRLDVDKSHIFYYTMTLFLSHIDHLLCIHQYQHTGLTNCQPLSISLSTIPILSYHRLEIKLHHSPSHHITS